MCYEVDYPGDAGKDYMLLEEIPNAFKTYAGVMKNEGLDHIAFNLPDRDDGEEFAGVSNTCMRGVVEILVLKIFVLTHLIVTISFL